ncbi:alpha/beta hydrolase [Streptomyces sp. NPDC006743]|uniref:alpha/beta hydrolase n=1 Tax=Streptomyces sp. NPDC006743 TaxID=3154480 RepID=UPI003455C810
MDLATLKNLNPSEFEQAADGYRETSDMAGAAKDEIDNVIIAGMNKSLHGEALKAAIGELKKLSANFHYTQIECSLASVALNGFAYDMDSARKKLLSALDDAEAKKFTVNPDGSVTYPAGPSAGDDKEPSQGGSISGATDPTAQAVERQSANFDPNPHHAEAQVIADRITAALKEATEADGKWAPKLRALKADDDLTVSDRDWRDAHSDAQGVTKAAGDYLDSIKPPPDHGTPQQNADWWKGLTLEEREAYISTYPDLVGKLDGLPAETRDEANRTVLDEQQAAYQARLNSIPEPPEDEWKWISSGGYASKVHTTEWIEWNSKYGDEYRHLKSSLKGMEAIQNRIDGTGKEGLPPAYVLGFSAEGNGRAIIATGNPDTAQNQAVFVPGTTSNLGGIGGNIDHMTELWRQTNEAAPGSSVSTITWLGYDAPQDIVKDSPFEHYAYDGAPAYRQFMDGLDVSHTGPGEPHRTAIGHSYGTTLIGAAAQTGHLSANDVILAGSPGVKVGSADEMDAPHGHVWNEEAPGDLVPDIGRWGHGGTEWKVGGGTFIIPSDPNFGANQMNTQPEGSGPAGTVGSHGHSEYWNHGTTSLKNQALVVVGKYGYVTAPQ